MNRFIIKPITPPAGATAPATDFTPEKRRGQAEKPARKASPARKLAPQQTKDYQDETTLTFFIAAARGSPRFAPSCSTDDDHNAPHRPAGYDIYVAGYKTADSKADGTAPGKAYSMSVVPRYN